MKTTTEYKQKGLKVGSAGSFFNQLMSHNSTIPVVGKGATQLYYSDRVAYEVIEVNEKEKSCVIQRYDAKRIDRNGMSEDQTYEYKKLAGEKITLFWKYNSWRRKSEGIIFTDEACEKYINSLQLKNAYTEAGGTYEGRFLMLDAIPGITKKIKSWNKVNIIFGVKQQYYDFSF